MSLTQEQLKMRLTGVTGSEIAAIAGLNPWSSPIDVWQTKMGKKNDDLLSNPNLIRGQLFEKPILQWYCIISQREVHPQPTIRHSNYPLIMATPDGVSKASGTQDRVLEVKCPQPQNARKWGRESTDEIDELYLPQVMFELAVTGLQTADVVMFCGAQPQIYHVEYNEEFFQALREIGEKFYVDYVQTGVPPPIDASPAYGDYLAQFAPMRDASSSIDLCGSDDAMRWMQQLREAQKAGKYWASMEEEAKNNLKALMGENASARVPGGRITWRNTKQVRRIQWPELAKSLRIPSDVIEQHVKLGDAPRPFKVTWDKEEHG